MQEIGEACRRQPAARLKIPEECGPKTRRVQAPNEREVTDDRYIALYTQEDAGLAPLEPWGHTVRT